MGKEGRDNGVCTTSRVIQLVFNWYSHEKGDMFYDFTVGYPANIQNNPRFPHEGKLVVDIKLCHTPDLHGIITFGDGSTTTQYNVNSWSTGFIEEKADE